VGGPASIVYYDDGTPKRVQWLQSDVQNREDGPAIIYYYPNGVVQKEYWIRIGNTHRVDGPAVIDYSKDGKVISYAYRLNGDEVTLEELDARNPNTSEERLIDLYLKDDDTSKLAYANPNFPKYIKDWIDF
jgi:antitoxin component YwqK of YwqJK toxin-antitoxin module